MLGQRTDLIVVACFSKEMNHIIMSLVKNANVVES